MTLVHSDLQNTYRVMGHLERLCKDAKDILDCRIETVLEDMSLTPLCDLPEDEPVTVEQFLALTETTCNDASQTLTK